MTVDIASLVSDNLEIWTTAVERKSGAGRGGGKKLSLYGMERLRALVLDLAVRGKLVTQDPNEEPASALLLKIKSAKPHFILKHGLPKQRPRVAPIEQTPFDLPGSWSWTRLGDIAAYIQRGKSPIYSDGSGILVVSQRCVQWAGLDLSVAKEISRASLSSYEPYRYLLPGDLLWNSTGTGTIGRVIALSEVPDGLVCDSHVTLVRCPWVDARYLQSWLASNSVYGQIELLASGSTNQIEWTAQLALDQLVPLPPFAEQKRIVVKVDELMALCDALEAESAAAMAAHQALVEALLATLAASTDAADLATNWSRLESHFDTLFTTEAGVDVLKQTILELAVRGKLVPQEPKSETILPKYSKLPIDDKLPDEWRLLNFGKFCNIQGGNQPPKSQFISSPKEGYVQLIQIRDLGDRPVPTYIPIGSASRLCKSGEILIGRYGASVGKVFWANDGAYNVALAKFLWPEDAYTANFAFLLLSSSYLQVPLATASRSAQAGFNKGDLANINFPLPPVEEQQRIVARFHGLMALCDALKARITSAATTQKHLADTIVEQAAA